MGTRRRGAYVFGTLCRRHKRHLAVCTKRALAERRENEVTAQAAVETQDQEAGCISEESDTSIPDMNVNTKAKGADVQTDPPEQCTRCTELSTECEKLRDEVRRLRAKNLKLKGQLDDENSVVKKLRWLTTLGSQKQHF